MVKDKAKDKQAQIVFLLPENLKRRFKSKLILEGLTAKSWIIGRIEKYIGETSKNS